MALEKLLPVNFKELGEKIVSICYDIIPLRLPELYP
jgi:hypothetical protein